jgi:glycerol-1-phosphate dehydrogenase [NAD(P)+]
MSILSRDVTLPVFMCIEEDASTRLESLLSAHHLKFSRYLVLTGAPPLSDIAAPVAASLRGTVEQDEIRESTAAEVERVKNLIDRFAPDIVAGVGGGMVLDTAKCAASERAIGFISIPTAVSNDGIASPVSVINFNGKTRSLQTHIPVAVVADLNIIRQAPPRTTRSGIGDLVSNLSASADWRLAYKRGKDTIDDFTETIARNSAVRIVEADIASLSDTGFLKVLVEGLIMSGIAMGICGSSRPCSGAEHMISHAVDHLFDKPSSHGEQAGMATRFTLALHRMPGGPVKALYQKLSIPGRPDDLGLSQREFMAAVQKAPAMRPGRYSILNEADKKQIDRAYHEAFET